MGVNHKDHEGRHKGHEATNYFLIRWNTVSRSGAKGLKGTRKSLIRISPEKGKNKKTVRNTLQHIIAYLYL